MSTSVDATGEAVVFVPPVDPNDPQQSPRTQIKETLSKTTIVLDSFKSFGNEIGSQLGEVAESLSESAAAFRDLKVLHLEKETLVQQNNELLRLQEKSRQDLELVYGQLEQMAQAQENSEKRRKELLKSLEEQKASLEARNAAMDKWRTSFQTTREKLDTTSEILKSKEEELRLLNEEIRLKETTYQEQAQKVKDRDAENEALQLNVKSLHTQMEHLKVEKGSWENLVQQQKGSMREKDNYIEGQSNRIHELEGHLKNQKQEISKILEEVEEIQSKMEGPLTETKETSNKTSKLAIIILVGVGIAAAVALLFFLNPQLAVGAKAMLAKVWSVLTFSKVGII